MTNSLILSNELQSLAARAEAAQADPAARAALPPAFAFIDWSDGDELADALFEAIVETIAASHGLDDEQTARLGYLADQVISI
ncbi:MAG: hypothetical protein LBS11_03210 [Oscillospiraceae bacterium]|jgi:hypothetical protein|nr:hypothetical protein [Oscillospiraceae bacterium]